MDLTGIIAISGHGGLFKVSAQMKNGLVAKSLVDGKALPVYASAKVSALDDISVFCASDDIPLKDVFAKIKEQTQAQPAPDAKKADDKEVIAFFGEVLPDYDRERVYKSDMRKILGWYNLLLANDLLVDAPEAEATTEDDHKAEEALKALKEKDKKPTAKTAGGNKVGGAQQKSVKTTTVRKTGA